MALTLISCLVLPRLCFRAPCDILQPSFCRNLGREVHVSGRLGRERRGSDRMYGEHFRCRVRVQPMRLRLLHGTEANARRSHKTVTVNPGTAFVIHPKLLLLQQPWVLLWASSALRQGKMHTDVLCKRDLSSYVGQFQASGKPVLVL